MSWKENVADRTSVTFCLCLCLCCQRRSLTDGWTNYSYHDPGFTRERSLRSNPLYDYGTIPSFPFDHSIHTVDLLRSNTQFAFALTLLPSALSLYFLYYLLRLGEGCLLSRASTFASSFLIKFSL
jgi:hypothetical protein